MLRNRDLKFHCEFVGVRVERTDTPFTALCRAGQVLRLPIAHGEGNYYAPPETLDGARSRPAGSCSATPTPTATSTDARQSERLAQQHRRHLQRGAQCRRPDAASGARVRAGARQRATACVLFESVVDALSRRSGAAGGGAMTRHRRRRRSNVTASRRTSTTASSQLRRPRAESHRARPVLGDVVRALQLQELARASEDAADRRARASCRGPGENAGAVDIGDGLAAVFKIESHNHPSFIEPYQGAATGVGGIIRDIFTMGARPIALLDALRFGPLDEPRNRRILQGVVAGIGGYGNSIGIPTVGGEVMFDETYSGNPLVNVFCLGIAKHDALVKGTRERRRQSRVLRRRQDRPRRHSRRDDGVGGVRRQVGGEAAGRAGRRSVHGEAAARGLPRGDGDRRVRRRAGHGRRGTDVRDVARPDRAAASASRSTSRTCRSARPA